MGEVIDLTTYRAKVKVPGEKRLRIEIFPPAFSLEHVEKGGLEMHYCAFLERMIRDLLDEIE